MVVRILGAEEALAPEGTARCKRCNCVLEPSNTTDSSTRYGVCLECSTKILGEEMSQSISMLLAKGNVVICYYKRELVYKMRVEVRSARRSELQAMKDDLGVGRVFKHSEMLWRWSVASLRDLDRLGKILGVYQPELGILIQKYAVQPNKDIRSAFAEAVILKMGVRTIHIVEHI